MIYYEELNEEDIFFLYLNLFPREVMLVEEDIIAKMRGEVTGNSSLKMMICNSILSHEVCNFRKSTSLGKRVIENWENDRYDSFDKEKTFYKKEVKYFIESKVKNTEGKSFFRLKFNVNRLIGKEEFGAKVIESIAIITLVLKELDNYYAIIVENHHYDNGDYIYMDLELFV